MNLEKLRGMLAEQMDKLRAGNADVKNVNAMVNAAGKVIASVRLELDYAKMIGITPSVPFMLQNKIPKKSPRRIGR